MTGLVIRGRGESLPPKGQKINSLCTLLLPALLLALRDAHISKPGTKWGPWADLTFGPTSLHPAPWRQRQSKAVAGKAPRGGGERDGGRRGCRQEPRAARRAEAEPGERAGPRQRAPVRSGCMEKPGKPFRSSSCKARGHAVLSGVPSAGTQPRSPPHRDPPKNSQGAGRPEQDPLCRDPDSLRPQRTPKPSLPGCRQSSNPPFATSAPAAPLQLISPQKSVAVSDPCPAALSHALQLAPQIKLPLPAQPSSWGRGCPRQHWATMLTHIP